MSLLRTPMQTGRLHLKSLAPEDFFKIGLIPAGGEAFVFDADVESGFVL